MYFWMFAVPLFVLSACWGWLIFGQRWGWISTETPEEVNLKNEDGGEKGDTIGNEHLESWRMLLHRWRWLLGLMIMLVGIIIYTLLFAPPRLGGQISILPYTSGRPFYSLHWLRNFSHNYYQQIGMGISLVGSLLSLGILILAHFRRWRLAGELSFLLISLTLAAFGQWFLNADYEVAGTIIYWIAITGFVSWAWMTRKRFRADLEPYHFASHLWEGLLVLCIFGLAVFARFYVLSDLPYGVEGDESKWVYEIVQLMVDGQPTSDGEYHRDALPLSFYMQAPFQQLFSVGIYSARVGVAFYSLLGCLAFYWLLRQIAPLSLALLSSFLLSISIFDISASRLANVESHVKFWPILALAFLAMAVRTRRWEIYALSGLFLTLGLLTYDTVWPIFLVVFLLALIELSSQDIGKKATITQIAALLFPTLLAVPVLIPYMVSRLSYYNLGEKGWQSQAGSTIAENLSAILRSWFVLTSPDFLYNRQGPIINAVLLPFLALGVVIALFTLRKQFSRWILLWAGMILIPVPLLTSSPLGRVYYPALPAIYALIGVGIYLLAHEVARFLGPNLAPFGLILGIAVIIWLPLLNLFIYFNEVDDPEDRLIRSEIRELVQQSSKDQSFVYLPYFSELNDPLFFEQQSIEFGLRQHLSVDQIADSYEHIHYDKLFPTLIDWSPNGKSVDILLDKNNTTNPEKRDLAQENLIRCFPEGILHEGHFFDRYSLSPAAIAQPICRTANVSLMLDADDTYLASSVTPILMWSSNIETVSQVHLLCSRMRPDAIWVEAEDFEMGDGWMQDTAFVENWTGNGYLVDDYDSNNASVQIELDPGEQNYAWVRYYKRVIDNSPAYVTVDDQIKPFAQGQEESLNKWLWGRVGPFTLGHENSEWIISRPYNEDPQKFMALFIDAVVFTTDPAYSPLDDPILNLSPVTEYYLPEPTDSGEIKPSLRPGRYYCAVEIESDLLLIGANGSTPVRSNLVEIGIPDN